jgi:phosphate transport system permease protein
VSATLPGPAADAGSSAAESASRAQRRAAERARPRALRRRRRARVMTGLTAVAALVPLAALVAILGFLIVRGVAAAGAASAEATGRDAFTSALAGSLLLLAIAGAIGVPVGLGAGLYLHDRRGTRRAALLRYLTDVLLGVPAVVLGIVAWQQLVRPVGHFSAWAGGAALAALVVPLVARTTDDVLALVPASLAEAALALGYPRWRTQLTVVLRASVPGVVTGVLVAVARVAGEAAPLLFTAFGNQFRILDPDGPVAALPLQIYGGALGASADGRRQAYVSALVLIAGVALFGVAARRAARRVARAGR